MSFTENCVLHSSNPRIWRKLLNFGLHLDSCCRTLTARTKDNRLCTAVRRGVIFNIKEEEISENLYDCRDNEDLFFALASMRDDNDLYQWFIYDNRSWDDDNPTRFWFICKQESIEVDMGYDQMYNDCEKATRKEIIAHFMGLDDDPIVKNQ